MLRRVLAGCLLALTALIAAATPTLALWPTARLVALKLAGRSECSWRHTLRALEDVRRAIDLRDSIERSARLVASDGNLQLWEVPEAGRFWMHGRFGRLNAVVFAEYQKDIYSNGDVRVRPGDIVLDCGADYGAFTRKALQAGARTVLAIEIAPGKEPCLRRTFENEIAGGRVVVIPRGVWDRDDVLELDGDSVVLARGQTKVKVPVTTIDQIVSAAGLARVDFIKMDIEGAEKRALKGAAGTLRKFRPRLAIAAEHLPDDYLELPKSVRGILPGYTVSCGSCRKVGWRVIPDVLFFQ
ncbi:MAG: FkbM family methyltransferase [Acidobacteriota bacterium]